MSHIKFDYSKVLGKLFAHHSGIQCNHVIAADELIRKRNPGAGE